MNNRGELDPRVMLWVAYLIFAAIIFGAMLGWVRSEAKGDTFQQIVAVEDLGTSLNLYDAGYLELHYAKGAEYNTGIDEKKGNVVVRKDVPILNSYEGNYNLEVEDKKDEVVIKKV